MREIFFAFFLGIGTGASAFYILGPPLPPREYRFVTQDKLIDKVLEDKYEKAANIESKSAVFKLIQKLRTAEPEQNIPISGDKFLQDFIKAKLQEVKLIIKRAAVIDRPQATNRLEKFELYCEVLRLEKDTPVASLRYSANFKPASLGFLKLNLAAQAEMEPLAERYYLDHKAGLGE